MTDLFSSARLTFRRAEHHIDDFNAVVNGFIHENPWTYLVEKNADGTQVTHKLKLSRPLPEELACILFDAANNLRATLDQAGFAAAVASGKISPKSTKFPFGDDLPGLNNAIARGGSNDLPPEILTLFRSFKPYKGGNDALWALNKLCNTKKHCLLVPLQIAAMRLSFVATCDTGLGSVQDPEVRWNPEENEIVLMRAGPEVRLRNENFSFSVAIQSIDVFRSKQASGVLAALLRIVQSILLGTEAECRRLRLVP